MRHIALTFFASIFCLTASAEPKYSLLRPELEAAVSGLWPILSKATGSDQHEDKEFAKEFIDRLMPLLDDLHPLTPQQRLYLSANRPIRDDNQYRQRVTDLPEERWNNEAKIMLKSWFEADARTEGEKEAMAVLLILIEPNPKKDQQPSEDHNGEQGSAGQPATRSESDSEGSDKPQPESDVRSR